MNSAVIMFNRVFPLLPAFFMVVILTLPERSEAHESRPLSVELTERSPGVWFLRWATPPSVPDMNLPYVTLTEPCTPAAERMSETSVASLYHCPSGLSEARLGIEYPMFNPSVSSLVRTTYLSGEIVSAFLDPEELVWQPPSEESVASVASDYFALGVRHILTGYDHLLFLLCLMMLAATWRRVLIAITGFTIAHSLTLVSAALDLVRIPVPPVEAGIALSVVFLASEIVRDRRDTLTWRYPIVVSGTFGLLHGLGFAAVLSEIGLPQTEVAAALLAFNLGVEAGQISFAGGIVLVWLGLNQLQISRSREIEAYYRPVAYIVGSFGAFWVVDRTMQFA